MNGLANTLLAEATTAMNVAEYGRLIYDLAIRRSLAAIGEEMTKIAPSTQLPRHLYTIKKGEFFDSIGP